MQTRNNFNLDQDNFNFDLAHLQNSPAQNHELVRLHLDIGQCRFIHKLLAKEYRRIIENGIHDKNDAVMQLLDNFEKYAYPRISKFVHRDDSLEQYIDSQDDKEISELLSASYVQGAFEHE